MWILRTPSKRTEVVPIEVKAAENLNSKSLKTFVTANKGLRGVRFSLAPYREQDWICNIPLYAVSAFFRPVTTGD